MTQEAEKALELGNIMYNGHPFNKTKEEHIKEVKNAKRCALIAANAILNEIPYINIPKREVLKRMFWMDVIQEIEKL